MTTKDIEAAVERMRIDAKEQFNEMDRDIVLVLAHASKLARRVERLEAALRRIEEDRDEDVRAQVAPADIARAALAKETDDDE